MEFKNHFISQLFASSVRKYLCSSRSSVIYQVAFVSCRPPLLTNWPSKKKYWRIKAHHNFLQIYYSSAKDASAQKNDIGRYGMICIVSTDIAQKDVLIFLVSSMCLSKKVHCFCNIWSVNSKSLIWPQEDKKFQLFNRKFCFWKTFEITTVG